MAVRFVPKRDMHLVVKGKKKFFSARHRDGGLPGYPPEAMQGLSREQQTYFSRIEVDDVEQATAAPGEKRARKPRTADTE